MKEASSQTCAPRRIFGAIHGTFFWAASTALMAAALLLASPAPQEALARTDADPSSGSSSSAVSSTAEVSSSPEVSATADHASHSEVSAPTLAVGELPASYHLAYDLTKGNEAHHIEMAVDTSGNVFYRYDDHAELYLRESGGYQLLSWSGTAWQSTRLANTALLTRDDLEEIAEPFMRCVFRNAAAVSSAKAVARGTQTVAGRACTTWELTSSMLGYTNNVLFVVDDENGICLAWSDSGNLAGYDLGLLEAGTCTSFDLSIEELDPAKLASELNGDPRPATDGR